jgi:WD40 repeat protein
VEAIAWHPEGKQLAVASGRTVHIWGLGGGTDEPRLTLGGHLAQVVGLAFSPDGGLLASTSYDHTLRLWDTRSGRLVLAAPGAWDAWFGRDGRLAFARGTTRLVLARVDPPEGVRTLYRAGAHFGFDLDVSPDGRLLAAAEEGRGVYLWDAASGAEAGVLPVGRTERVAFEPGGTHLVTGGLSPPARWPVTPGPAGASRLGPPALVAPAAERPRWVSLSRDGRTLVANVGGEVHVLEWPGGAVRHRLRARQPYRPAAVSPDGRWVAAWCLDNREAWVWDALTGEVVHRLPLPGSGSELLEFSPDGRWLVATTPEEYAGFETGTWRWAWAVGRAGTFGAGAAFSPDGRLLAVGHSTTLVKLYRAGTAEEVAALPSPDPHILRRLRFAPDGARLVAVTESDRLFVWDLRVIRARLARFGLDWDLPPYPPADSSPAPVRVNVDLGELHPVRRQAAECRRVLRDKPDDPSSGNNLAWCLVTGPPDLRDPAAALPLAETAVRLKPTPEHLNTLGVVYYRLGRHAEAAETLNRSIAAAKEATAFNTFVLAMCHHRLGEPEKARAEYSRAVAWMELYRPDDEELIRFRAEAEALLPPEALIGR